MTEAEASDKFHAILAALGIHRGDVLYLGVNIGRLPLPSYAIPLNREAVRDRERRWCDFVYNSLLQAVGPEGTLLVPTFTYSYAGASEPYVHETTPSETGPFTEFVRRLPNARRSLHPIHSVAGIGKHAAAILEDVGKAAYGAMSAFARLTPKGTKFLCLGTTIGDSLTYVHHLEQLYGTNHRYNKIFTTPVSRCGQRVSGPWLCYVRFLGVAARPRIANIEGGLRAAGVLRETFFGTYPNQVVDSSDVDRIGLAMLANNPWAFLPKATQVFLDESLTTEAPSDDSDVHFTLSFGPKLG